MKTPSGLASDEVANGFAAVMCVGPTLQRGIGLTTISFAEIELRTGRPLPMTNRHFARHVKRNDTPSSCSWDAEAPTANSMQGAELLTRVTERGLSSHPITT
jgi:hypothetical protein